MKITLLSLLISLIAFSCNSPKRIAKICATCPTKTIIKDSTHVEIKERLVNVFITDTFNYYLPNPCAKLCDSVGNLKPNFKAEIKSTKGTKINLFVKDNQLHFVDVIDSLKRIITVNDSIISRFSSKVIELPAQCKLEHLSWWDKLWIKLGRFWALILILFLGYRIVKFYIKWHKP